MHDLGVEARLLGSAKRLSPKLVAWRRHLHMHPELSFQEVETQAWLRTLLVSEFAEAELRTVAETGLLLTLRGQGRAPKRRSCVAVRADMDALPIEEVVGRTYGSTRPGVMHACGHDVHTACALGAAHLLYETRHEWGGTVKLIFQPGEELLPGGATKVIADGALREPSVEAITALHVAPSLPVGQFGLRGGSYMASTDELYLELSGSGGHGALAHQHDDLVAAAAQLLVTLQQLVSRHAPPEVPTVLSFGKIESEGGATNVLATRVSLEGTLRTYDAAWRSEAHRLLHRMVAGVRAALGVAIELEVRAGYPALSNDLTATREVGDAIRALVGASDVVQLSLRPTAEDFAWYLQEVPGCFFRLGVRNEARGITAAVHQREFDVDEDCLPLGAAALAASALALLG